jgi:excisionase family DNA binding protein
MERQLRLIGGEYFMVTRKFRTSELYQINLLTIQEVADWAKVSTKTVYRWISDNKIPAIRLGNRTYRIPEKSIIDFLRQNGYDHLLPNCRPSGHRRQSNELTIKTSKTEL